MKNIIYIILLLGSMQGISQPDEYSVYYLTAQIKESVQENKRQKKLNDTKTVTIGLQENLKNQNEEYKDRSESIKRRLGQIGFALETLPASQRITRSMENITDNIGDIINLIAEYPELVLFGDNVNKIIELGEEAQMNMIFIVAVMLELSNANLMERADRTKLLKNLVTEIRLLEKKTRILKLGMTRTLRSLSYKNNSFSYVNDDFEIFNNLIND